MDPAGRRARGGRTRGLALYLAVLALGSAVAVAIGVARRDLGMVAIAATLCALFAHGAWTLNPRRLRSAEPSGPDWWDRFFARLGIEWFTGPPDLSHGETSRESLDGGGT